MRSNKELELLPYNLEIEENAKKLKKEKQETHKKNQTPWQTTRVHLRF